MHQLVDTTKCDRTVYNQYMAAQEARTAQPPFFTIGRVLTKGLWLAWMMKPGQETTEKHAKELVTCWGRFSLYD